MQQSKYFLFEVLTIVIVKCTEFRVVTPCSSKTARRFGITYKTVIQTGGTVAQPTSYTMGKGGSFPGGKRPEREADHSPLTGAQIIRLDGVVLS
jgi:hypothetical protein